ncbi:hypothetical protein ABZ341_41685 [Streptomyces sp. NPDC006173]|uniref:hypothetical protein n=1 Tax=Streptomyces sp. NPDC006173 TaxID=3155349 RepID=UPI0033E4A804
MKIEGYSARLQEAGRYADDCYLQWKNSLVARNALVVEAIDNGHAGHQAARDIGRKQPHIIRILSNSDPELKAS